MNYFNTSRDNRISHVDLTDACILVDPSRPAARKALESFLGVAKPVDRRWHTCHLCENCSNREQICINPKHIYFGTARENALDIPELVRRERTKKMMKGLTPEVRKRQVESYPDGVRSKTMAQTGSKPWWTDGIANRRSVVQPGPGWCRGMTKKR